MKHKAILRKLRFLLWVFQLTTKRHFFKLTLLVLLSLLTILVGIKLFSWFLANIKSTYSEGLIGSYSPKDLPDKVLLLVGQGLVKFDQSGKAVPAMAASWETKDAAKTFRFKLRDNIFWHDETRVKAVDLEFSFPGTAVTKIDDQTIEFRLSQAFSPFPSLLTKPLFKSNQKFLVPNKNFVGTGPYKLAKLTKNGQFVKSLKLTSVIKSQPNLIFKFYPNKNALIEGFKKGEVRAISVSESIDEIAGRSNLEIVKKPDYAKVVAIFFNLTDEILAKKELRQALNLSIDRKIFQDEAAWVPVSPKSSVYNGELKPVEVNLPKAKEQIAKLKLGSVKLTLTTLPAFEETAAEIAKFWQEAGVETEIKVEKTVPETFQLLLAGQEIPTDPDQYTLWHSTQKETNITKYASPKVDKLLEDGREILDEAIRREKYLEFQKEIYSDLPAIFLYYPTENLIYYKKSKPQVEAVESLRNKL